METWVYPAILALHPHQAKLMLDYRVRHLEQAKVKARKNGHKGAQYPWESSPSGLYKYIVNGWRVILNFLTIFTAKQYTF